MPRKAGPAGSQRTLTMTVRFKPQVRDVIEKKIDQLSVGKKKRMTHSELVRIAVWEYCKDSLDPREP